MTPDVGSFSIQISRLPEKSGDEIFLRGKITIGDFSEYFHADASFWCAEEYISHWEASLREICANKNAVVLFESVGNPDFSNFVRSWALFRIDDYVFFQNRIIFASDFNGKIPVNDSSALAGERKTMNEDGQEISEWSLSVASLWACANRSREYFYLAAGDSFSD